MNKLKQQKPSRGSEPLSLLKATSYLISVIVFFTLVRYWVCFNITPSMPIGMYVKARSETPKVNSIVIFENPCPEMLNTTILMKEVTSIENGMVTVLGHHPRSFDSRVFGPISIEELTVVHPLFTRETEYEENHDTTPTHYDYSLPALRSRHTGI